MLQSYYVLSSSHIPKTRILSYLQFCDGQKQTIKSYLLSLFSENEAITLSCRQISQLSGIEVQSLTCPLKELVTASMLEIRGIEKSTVSNRMVQVYGKPLSV